MGQQIVYLKAASGNWDDANAWNTAATGSGTDVTNPQNGGGTTYICDLNAKTVAINVAVSVDQIRTGATNAGGTFSIPNSTAATITLATVTVGLYSNYNGTMISWGTGTCSLTVNGDVEYNSTSTSGMLTVGTSQTITINGCLTNLSTGYSVLGSGSGVLNISNVAGTALSVGAGRGISWGSTGNLIVGGAWSVSGGIGFQLTAGATVSITGNGTITAGTGINNANGSVATTHTGNITTSGSAAGVSITLGSFTLDGLPLGAGISITISGGTLNWTGARTLAEGQNSNISQSGGTINLATASAALTITNSGFFSLRKTGGTLNVTAAGGTASIIKQIVTAQAFVTDGAVAITGPTLPTAGNTLLGSGQFGYAGTLLTPTLVVPGRLHGSGTLTKTTGANARGGSGTCAKIVPGSVSSYDTLDIYVKVDSATAFQITFWHKIDSGFNGSVKISVYDTDQTAKLLDSSTVTLTDDGDYHQYTSGSLTPSATGICRISIEVEQGAHSGTDAVYIDDGPVKV